MRKLKSLRRHVKKLSLHDAYTNLEEMLRHLRRFGSAAIRGYSVEPREYMFLVLKKYPEVAEANFSDGESCDVPLIHLLRFRAPLEIIQEVVRMYPNIFKDKERLFERPPLIDAIYFQCDVEVVTFLLETNPEATSSSFPKNLMECLLDSHSSIGLAPRFDWDNFAACFRLLYEKFPPQNWNDADRWSECRNQLLSLNGIPPSLLAWLAPKERYSYSGGRCVFSLPGRHQNSGSWIQNLSYFVPKLDCEELELSVRCLDGKFLGSLLSEVELPSTIAIQGGDYTDTPPQVPFRIEKSCLEKLGSSKNQQLSIQNFGGCSEGVNALLLSFRVLPKLKRLSLGLSSFQRDDKVPCTDSVISLLEAGTLDCFELWGLKLDIDVKMLSQALQESTHSKAFLQFSPTANFQGHDCNQEIAYHSAMNRHGRASLSSSDTTRRKLVDCLSSVTGAYQFLYPANLEESVLYGLLHQAPGLWATASAPQRKRLSSAQGPTCHKKLRM